MSVVLALSPKNYATENEGFTEIEIPLPIIGGKCWVLDHQGQFVLERGPGTLRTIACAHAGSGTLVIYDGLPNAHGEIPVEVGTWRQLFRANPVVMGSWMLDAGFQYGLTIRHYGGQMSTPAIASIVWMPYKKAK